MTSIENRIEKYFETVSLKLETDKPGRFFDQKIKPDVTSFVSKLIIDITKGDKYKKFNYTQLRDSKTFRERISFYFNKPKPDKKTENEFNKFIPNTLSLFLYCGLLQKSKEKKGNHYLIEHLDIIEYVSQDSFNSFKFLAYYCEALLKHNGIYEYFNQFQIAPSKSTYLKLESVFAEKFGAKERKSDLDIERIFHPLFKVLCLKYGAPGFRGKGQFKFKDLLYNTTNPQDKNKPKNISRQEYAKQVRELEESPAAKITKSKNQIRQKHKTSEVKEPGSDKEQATQVHHIFMASDYPQFADYPENLIKLTATQHYSKAHPDNNTSIVDSNYQLKCLLSKCDSIKNDFRCNKENQIYVLDRFKQILSDGLGIEFDKKDSIDDIKESLLDLYNK